MYRIWKCTRTWISRKFRVCSISHRNWYWNILNRLWMCMRLTVRLPHGQERHYLMIKWFRGRKQKYVSSQTPYCYLGKMWDSWRCHLQDGKVKGKNSKCPLLLELLGIDGEAIEFEWNIFQGFTSLQIFQKIQNDLQERNTDPEQSTDRIIFISMCNDIDWTEKRNDEIRICSLVSGNGDGEKGRESFSSRQKSR